LTSGHKGETAMKVQRHYVQRHLNGLLNGVSVYLWTEKGSGELLTVTKSEMTDDGICLLAGPGYTKWLVESTDELYETDDSTCLEALLKDKLRNCRRASAEYHQALRIGEPPKAF
jgi:hypothetical protein